MKTTKINKYLEEAKKIGSFYPILLGILAALKSVFVGQAFAFFTPNRIGEYAGRTLFLSSGNKLMGLAQMAWTSYAQLLITICIGSVALFINISHYPWMHSISMIGVQLLSPLFALFALVFYLYQSTWKGWLRFFNVIQISNPIKFTVSFNYDPPQIYLKTIYIDVLSSFV